MGHFHYINKGECPFQDAVSPSKLKSLQKDADLTDEQTELVKDMAQYAKENGTSPRNAYVRVVFVEAESTCQSVFDLGDYNERCQGWRANSVLITEAEFQRITKERSYGDDFYWVAQLFDRKWRPHDFEE